jgi:hypothetical protein
MSIFGKSLGDYARFARTGMILIVLMGLARFITGISGVPYDRATHLLSVSILTFLLSLIYGQKAAASGFGGYRHLLPMVYMLSASMYGFIVVAILLEGWGGIHGYFHHPFAPLGMSVTTHAVLQLIAGLGGTPLALWGMASLGFLLSRYLGFLRHAFLFLCAMFVLRVLVGATSLPYSIGTWFTSLTLLAMVLSVYHGYRAPSHGFNRYHQVVLIGTLISISMTLLIIYGIAVTTGLMIPNYFHAPGQGFQPADMSVAQHIRGHLLFSFFGMILMSLLALIGFAIGKRKAVLPAGQTA